MNDKTPTPELVALFHPLKYYVRAARSQLGSCRPDDDEDDADFWDGLTAVMKAMDGDSGWDDAHVHGWRMVDGIRVFSITPPSGLLPPQEFVRYDDHLATRAATVPQGVLDSWFPSTDAEEYLPLIAAWIPKHPLQQLTQDDYRIVRLIEGKWWSNDGLCDTHPDYVRKLDPPPAGRKSHISYHNETTPPPAELGEES